MTLKKPRSWAEAAQHPGISHIEDERDAVHKSPDGIWDGVPFFCYLNQGWSWDGLTAFGFYGFKELQQEWDNIVFDLKQET